VHVFRNCDLLDEEQPLVSYYVADPDRRYKSQSSRIYSENVKRRILWEALDFIEGKKSFDDLVSNLDDHSVPANIMRLSIIMRLGILTTQFLHPITVTELLLLIFLYPLYRVAAWLRLADYAHQLKLKRARFDATVVNLGADADYADATQRYLRDFKGILQEGYDKYKHHAFQVWGVDGYIAILSVY
jgi:hypothetical protein